MDTLSGCRDTRRAHRHDVRTSATVIFYFRHNPVLQTIFSLGIPLAPESNLAAGGAFPGSGCQVGRESSWVKGTATMA
jgi:hypothetical protein